MASQPTTDGAASSALSVLSLNVWGLKFVSKDRPERIRAIAEYLASSNTPFDIVCLQELWINTDYDIVRQRVQEVYPFARFFHTGALGSGLAIFTRFPIISGQALPYSLSGTPLEVVAGDFFVNKAAGKVVIEHPVLGEVEIWDTHMHAAGDGGKETRRAHRITQAWQLARQVRSGVERGRHVLVAGDFNSTPFSLPISILKDVGELGDSWGDAHSSATASQPSCAEDALDSHGMTCDSPLNSYSAGKPLSDEARKWFGKRLDYIFYRSPSSSSHVIEPQTSDVVLTETVPGRSFSYSDHFGIHTVFKISSGRGANQGERSSGPTRSYDSSSPLINVSSSQSSSASVHRATDNLNARLASMRSALVIIRAYHVESQSRAKLHLRLVLGAIVFGLALTISSGWQPKSYIQPIWTILGIAAGAAGATFLYTGFVWGRWENNLLKEYEEQMEVETAWCERQL